MYPKNLAPTHTKHTYRPVSKTQQPNLPPNTQNLPGVCLSAVSEAVFNLTIGGLAAMAVQSALIWKDTNWQVKSRVCDV